MGGHEQTIVTAADGSGYAFVVNSGNKLQLSIYNKVNGEYDIFMTETVLQKGKKYNVTAVYKEKQILLYIYDSSGNLIEEVSPQYDGLSLNQKANISTLIGANPMEEENKYDTGCYLKGNVYNVRMWYNQDFNYDYIMKISQEGFNN